MPPMDGVHAPTDPTSGTHCPYCAMQCAMRLEWRDGRPEAVPRDFPTSRGGLCRKGWAAGEMFAAERLTTPLLRAHRGAPLEPASWDAALERIVAGIRAARMAGGAHAVGVFGGGALTNETGYALGKFARVVLSTRFIDYNGRFCMASAAAAGSRAFGLDRGLPFPLSDIAEAEAILIAGGNPAETLPVMLQYLEAQRAHGGRLIVADPRRSATAAMADLHLQLTPGSDAALANGMLHVAVRDRLLDEGFIAARTTGFPAVRRAVAAWWPDRVERATGVPERLLVRATHMLAEAATAMILSGRGPEQQANGVANALAHINLALALGKAGRRGCGWGTLTGQGNGQGGREHGQKADQLPGYRSLADPAHRAAVAAVWGVPPESLPDPGVSAWELLQRCGAPDGIRALLVHGCNLLVAAPDLTALRRHLAGLDLLVVADPFLSETAELADVVLPVAHWAEEAGTLTNLEGRLLLRERQAAPPPGVRTDLEILAAIAARLGRGSLVPATPRAAFEELRRASAGGPADYAGITWERIKAEQGVFWPCPAPDHPGTPRPFEDRFATPDGRARFHVAEHRPPAEEASADYPMILTTGRVLAHYNSGTQTRRTASLAEADPAPFVEINGQAARSLGIAEGDAVRLATRRGTAVLRARLVPTLRLDTVFVPFHWGGRGAANLLTNPVLDPVSRIPAFKACAVRVERVTPAEGDDTA
ncbi:molybdopterin oxidoreductase family protein [Paracraurococcus lichenis]|uniref:Molybdopterin oxidoreductase family protein n=1 Tax=Paracraurococcus lichenis TaxID=3064888 RepID=A0ABT9E8V7_9PROT|nr:molybdopterin oxidoreductase family protein [Paracraurococcus sp. LOR1-02]MDO9712637.1 molybdopterin oxidoreductase family protein [Paracraurococcus sp. LOR1-02]